MLVSLNTDSGFGCGTSYYIAIDDDDDDDGVVSMTIMIMITIMIGMMMWSGQVYVLQLAADDVVAAATSQKILHNMAKKLPRDFSGCTDSTNA